MLTGPERALVNKELETSLEHSNRNWQLMRKMALDLETHRATNELMISSLRLVYLLLMCRLHEHGMSRSGKISEFVHLSVLGILRDCSSLQLADRLPMRRCLY